MWVFEMEDEALDVELMDGFELLPRRKGVWSVKNG